MKPKSNSKQSKNDKQPFWSTFPGVLTAIAALITATAGLLAILNTIGVFEPQITPTPESTVLTPSLTPTADPAATPTPPNTPTVASAETSTPTQTTSVNAVVEDFEDGEAQGFNFEGEGAWEIIDDGEDMAIEIRTDESSKLHIDLPPTMFTSNIIEFEINFKEFPESATEEDWGSVDFIFREQSDGQQSYLLTIRPLLPLEHIELNYVPPGEGSKWEPIREYPIVLQPDEWHTIRLELQGTQISAFLDGTLMYSVEDSRLNTGALVFLVGQESTIQFDNIRAVMMP